MKPVIPKAWEGFHGSNDKTYAVLVVLAYLLDQICGADQWMDELDELSSEFSDLSA